MNTTKCPVCVEDIVKGSKDVSEVREKGILGLMKASKERKDDKHRGFYGLTTLLIHTSCRKNYTRIDTIKKDVRESSTSKEEAGPSQLRSSVPKFNFKNNCLLCAQCTNEKKKSPLDKRRIVHSVQTLTIQYRIREACFMRKDSWGEEVLGRLSSINDLVADEAVYHKDCYHKFMKPISSLPPKSELPKYSHVTQAMEEIFAYMEENTDCQFSRDEILGVVTGDKPQWRTIKSELERKYGDRILITPGTNRFNVPVVCFRDNGYKIISEAWYENRVKNEEEERLRIVAKAIEILRQDIQSQVYNTDTYPPSDDFLKDPGTLPQSLTFFIEGLLLGKTKRVEETKRKCSALGNAIIAIIRPRSFLSPLLCSLSLLLYRKYASKHLIDLLASLGFCASYHEAQKLEISAIYSAKPGFKMGAFNQFVFDNVDFNVCTIDGLNTLHAMGGIRCITPSNSLEKGEDMPRLNHMPSSHDIGELGIVPLQSFQKGASLESIVVRRIDVPEEMVYPQPFDTLWFIAKQLDIPLPEWKGYMTTITTGDFSEKTRVITLPLINAPPSNYDTVYTALHYASKLIQQTHKKLIVTFDQPLYWKAREIVAAEPLDSQISNCVVRLGGFHLLMSFLGSIGYFMAGSGLKELLCIVYAPLSVDKMLQGHAFARAVRGHFLATTALSNKILDQLQLTVEEKSAVTEILSGFLDEPPALNALNGNKTIKKLAEKYGETLEQLKANGPTAQLWIQYFKMVYLVKEYIHAERSGDWDAHLNCVKKMIPYFHASGHFPYAKSCQLYVQDMENLSSTLTPEQYLKFTTSGYFTMKRSDRFWSGVWSDMTIETTLMRSFKSRGGITGGRGVSHSVLSKWLVGMNATHEICASLEEFCGVLFTSSEQHKDFGQARRSRDTADIAKLSQWFDSYPPFPQTSEIISIASGVVGDATINCYDALRIGKEAMNKIVGLPFSSIKLSRKDRALPLSSVSSSIKIHDEKVAVDPTLLFQRMCISKRSDEDLMKFLEFELAPFPLALFNESGMRKTVKSVLYTMFEPTDNAVQLSHMNIVVDGGFLLHRVIWQKDASVATICNGYITYVNHHYPGTRRTVVFDGYSNSTNSTKLQEQKRRYRLKRSADINLTWNTSIPMKQEDFLSNPTNKSQLISLLQTKLQEYGIHTLEATDDADVLIIKTAIEQSTYSSVTVVGEDVDLAVLLIASTPPTKDILLLKPGRGKTKTIVLSSQKMQQSGFEHILFLHSFTGCDTTSSTLRKSKVGFSKLYLKSEIVKKAAVAFYNPSSTHAEVEEAGKMCFLKWYGAPASQTSLNQYRFQSFMRSVANIKPDISSLPPTEGAAKQHSRRTYLQVQQWLGNELPPQEWGWKRLGDTLVPIITEDPPAPEVLLKTIFCRCTKDCASGKCGCRKAMLNCSAACLHCQGNCLNGVPIYGEEEDEDDEPEAPIIADENYLDAEPLPGPSRPKKMKI